MILDNYWKYLAAVEDSRNNIATDTIRYPGIKNTSGTTFGVTTGAQYFSTRVDQMNHNLIVRSNTSIRVGTGDTEVTAGDYNLANDITASLSNVQNSQTITTNEEGKLITTYTLSATNNTANTITLKEVGIYKSSIWGATNDTGLTNNCFFARKLLDTPLEVPVGTSFTMTFNWSEG